MKNEKKVTIIAIIVVLVILLFPIRMNLKDGGSVKYKSLVYEATIIHELLPIGPEFDNAEPYNDGLEIKILGMTVYSTNTES